MIHLEKITWENWRKCNSLKVNESQSRFVANNLAILARAYVSCVEGEEGQALAIYNDDEIVGLLFYREFGQPKKYCYILDQFMIDEKFQGLGYGKQALNILIDMLKKEHKYDKIELEYCKENEAAKALYLNAGFYHLFDDYNEYGEMNIAYDL